MALATLCFVLAGGVGAYWVWSHVTALMVLRRFVAETGIPLEVHSAKWEIRLRELLAGHIRDLNLDVYYEPLKLEIKLDTPVDYARKGDNWSIQLAPTVTIGKLPPARGTIALELEVKRSGRNARAEGATIDLHLHDTQPLQLASNAGTVSASSWTLDGWIQWDGDWDSELDLAINQPKATTADGAHALKANLVNIHADTSWPKTPPLPLDLESQIKVYQPEYLHKNLFIDERLLSASLGFHFDGHRFENVDISVDKPVKLKIKGAYGDNAGQATFDFHGDLSELVDKRLAHWLEAPAPLLRGSTARGAIDLSGQGQLTPKDKLSASAKLRLTAEAVNFPARDIFMNGVSLQAPLTYPSVPGWGTVAVKQLDFHSVKLKNISLYHRLSIDGVDVTTENAQEQDEPVHQSVWGGAINVEHLFFHVAGRQGLEFTAAINGGPFQLSAIQSDLCVLADHPLKGKVDFQYPQFVLDHNSIRLVGNTNFEIFNGKAHAGDLSLLLVQTPRARFSIDWSDLDLHSIGEWTNFGDIRGSLNGSLLGAEFELTGEGPKPLSYSLTIQGSQRGGNKMSFYGRAIDNITGVLGIHETELPGPVGLLLSAMKTVRNWVPLKADVFGFQAKSDGEWTEIKTFDPPPEASTFWCDPQKHYLLCGNSFTIPLNTSGVYPLLMSTAAFHGWLGDRADYFKELMKNGKKTNSGTKQGSANDSAACKPLW